MIPCAKWGKSAAGTYRCHAVGEKCNEDNKNCPLKEGEREK